MYVGYAEDKEINNPVPGTFPIPWDGAPNTIFLGSPIVGQAACGTLPSCYDAGAIRLDNTGTSDITIGNVSVDIHSSIPGGKVFSLWGSFTVPAGKSVILTENPANDDPGYDNFDTSSYPANNCVKITTSPTVTITIGGVADNAGRSIATFSILAESTKGIASLRKTSRSSGTPSAYGAKVQQP